MGFALVSCCDAEDAQLDLVKDYFMGGELYALSWSLVEFVATSNIVRGLTIGPEDQQVSLIAVTLSVTNDFGNCRWLNG